MEDGVDSAGNGEADHFGGPGAMGCAATLHRPTRTAWGTAHDLRCCDGAILDGVGSPCLCASAHPTPRRVDSIGPGAPDTDTRAGVGYSSSA